MDDGGRTLLATIGLFASVGWGAIAHLYKLVFALPSTKRLEEIEARLNRRLDDLEKRVENLADKTEKDRVKSAGYFGRLDPRRRREYEEDPDG